MGTDSRKSRRVWDAICIVALACVGRRVRLLSSTALSVGLPIVNVATCRYARLSVIDVKADQESEGLSVAVVAAVGNCSKFHAALCALDPRVVWVQHLNAIRSGSYIRVRRV